jgi:hypothetical protein
LSPVVRVEFVTLSPNERRSGAHAPSRCSATAVERPRHACDY